MESDRLKIILAVALNIILTVVIILCIHYLDINRNGKMEVITRCITGNTLLLLVIVIALGLMINGGKDRDTIVGSDVSITTYMKYNEKRSNLYKYKGAKIEFTGTIDNIDGDKIVLDKNKYVIEVIKNKKKNLDANKAIEVKGYVHSIGNNSMVVKWADVRNIEEADIKNKLYINGESKEFSIPKKEKVTTEMSKIEKENIFKEKAMYVNIDDLIHDYKKEYNKYRTKYDKKHIILRGYVKYINKLSDNEMEFRVDNREQKSLIGTKIYLDGAEYINYVNRNVSVGDIVEIEGIGCTNSTTFEIRYGRCDIREVKEVNTEDIIRDKLKGYYKVRGEIEYILRLGEKEKSIISLTDKGKDRHNVNIEIDDRYVKGFNPGDKIVIHGRVEKVGKDYKIEDIKIIGSE